LERSLNELTPPVKEKINRSKARRGGGGKNKDKGKTATYTLGGRKGPGYWGGPSILHHSLVPTGTSKERERNSSIEGNEG